MNTLTLTLTTGGHHTTINTDTAHVTDWARAYFSPHWPEATATAAATAAGPQVTALHDGPPLDHDRPHTHRAVFARDHLAYTPHPDGTVTARNLTHPTLTYRYTPTPQHLEITHTGPPHPGHHHPCNLAVATTRFTRHLLHARLVNDGWTLLHAAAAELPTGHAVLALGGPGAGKTTTALTLATTGATLLATDCCYARPNPDGRLDLLPWPSAATIGLGLLNALGWTPTVRAHLNAGEPPHPTQHPAVTHALTTDRDPGPLFTSSGRERKAQLWPHQLQNWFHLPHALQATADRILQTRINRPAGTPAISPPGPIGPAVFTTGPNRYPDVLGITRHPATNHQQRVLQHLLALPHHELTLGHDHDSNAHLIHQASTPCSSPG
ncbi:hypothetical protein ABT354_19750 [Streptomyces sp. NPDC000594]|uniref:hypothetical protein n=1 Tax=Streptomyces sp. NPDC000594 TaxID=3154261 RepID=UPI00331B30ED